MNDPGVDGPVREAAEDLETNVYTKAEENEEKEEQDFLDPTSPLIAGTFGPMANAFSICALVETWRVYIPPGSNETIGQRVEDPSWLLAINAVSLASAVVANGSLLLNMAQRLPFAIAQPITTGGFYLASFLLIALVSVASSSVFRIQPTNAHALSQAFYYAIMAAALYFIIATLMVGTALGALRKHYPKEFRLTISQRTLMLQTISFMCYLLLGALVFSNVEGWAYLDAVYWADYTLLTVGLGSDFPPKTHLGRSLLFPFAIGGIVIIGLVIGSIRSLVLERGKVKMGARFTEKKREKVLSSVDPEQRTIKIGPFQTIKFAQKGLSELERREQEFYIMRHIQKSAERLRRYTALTMSTLAACILWFIGAVVFRASESKSQGWSYFQALYFSYTSLLTIGYGDLYPESNAGRAFFVLWSLLAVPTLTVLISNMGDTVVKTFSDFTIWLGSLTVLPDEKGVRNTVKAGLEKLGRQNIFSNDQITGDDRKKHVEELALDRLTKHIAEEELEEAEEAGQRGDELERDTHFYHYILAKEVREVMKDAQVSPPKEYSYGQWAYFLKLVGQDEEDPSLHRKPPIKADRSEEDGLVGIGEAGGKAEKPDPDDQRPARWSWLGTKSPLMGSQTEAEWILERLSATLERELRKMRTEKLEGKKTPPPISMNGLRKRKSGNPSSSGSDS
ncbi:voltage-gated potassium channel [Saccharata proteae CBS 121410]|uniref:Voltage-gated potassium channel n=1 Tax=Saccharata proteae CBS 121410 TaxID=1314787 RepID=A0A9P4I1D7_9PEZI|nr:voltage-gated potassium channel [Saccharata proteae CBS 121410]